MKRIVSLFFLAVLSFLVFSYIDEYQSLLAPFFLKNKGEYGGLFDEKDEKETVKAMLMEFNRLLSDVYLSKDASRVSRLPVSDEIKKDLYEEITVLRGKGEKMDVVLRELDITDMKRLSAVTVQVRATEKAGVRYLFDDAVPPSYTELEYEVLYTLAPGPEGLIVTAFEVTPGDSAGKNKE